MYNESIINKFLEPKNAGRIKNADANGSAKNEKCGDVLKIFIAVENDRIVDAKFKAFGSPLTICAADITCEKMIGLTTEEVLDIKNSDIEAEILVADEDREKLRQSILAEETIASVMAEYNKRQAKMNK